MSKMLSWQIEMALLDPTCYEMFLEEGSLRTIYKIIKLPRPIGGYRIPKKPILIKGE